MYRLKQLKRCCITDKRDHWWNKILSQWWNETHSLVELEPIGGTNTFLLVKYRAYVCLYQNKRFMMLVFADHLVITGKNTR